MIISTDQEQLEQLLRRVMREEINKAFHLNQEPAAGGSFAQELMKLPQKMALAQEKQRVRAIKKQAKAQAA